MSNVDEIRQKRKHKKQRHRSLSPDKVKHEKHRRKSGSESPKKKIKHEQDYSSDMSSKRVKREKEWSPEHYTRAGYDEHQTHRHADRHSKSDKHNRKDHKHHRHHSDDDEDFHRHHNRPIKQERENSEFREQRRERRENDERRRHARRQRGNNPFTESEDQEYGSNATNSEEPTQEKDQPDFELSGKLTEDTNTYKGVVIKYNQPPEARRPKKKWRLYPFKGDEALPVLHIHRSSAYLIGRERRIADIPVDHPSCSKQHAVLQYRLVEFDRPDGTTGRRVCPYVLDLNSANGTYVNNQRIDPERYVQLMEKDVVKFGFSSREYVLLHEKTDTSELNDEGESD